MARAPRNGSCFTAINRFKPELLCAPVVTIQLQHFPNGLPARLAFHMDHKVHGLCDLRFSVENNLSLITFLEYDGLGIVVPGDLEAEGWRSLLELPLFRKCLLATNIFIASHHGRQAGYCEEVFNYCNPDIIILSDKGVVHDSQEHDMLSMLVECGLITSEIYTFSQLAVTGTLRLRNSLECLTLLQQKLSL